MCWLWKVTKRKSHGSFLYYSSKCEFELINLVCSSLLIPVILMIPWYPQFLKDEILAWLLGLGSTMYMHRFVFAPAPPASSCGHSHHSMVQRFINDVFLQLKVLSVILLLPILEIFLVAMLQKRSRWVKGWSSLLCPVLNNTFMVPLQYSNVNWDRKKLSTHC